MDLPILDGELIGDVAEPVSTTACPWCATGTLSISEGIIGEWWHTGYHCVENGAGLERRERACQIAACNACEFAVEVGRDGMIGYQENSHE